MTTEHDEELCHKAKAALDALGPTYEDAVRGLTERGVTGDVAADQTCVLANYVRGAVPEAAHVHVDCDGVRVDGCWLTPEDDDPAHEAPGWLEQLVTTFDEGKLPALATNACAHCGVGVEPDKAYCLRCRSVLAEEGVLPRLAGEGDAP